MSNSTIGRALTRTLTALVVVSATAVSLAAQTDFGSPIGSGAGVGAATAPLGTPDRSGGGGRFSPTSNSGLNNARTTFLAATGGGLSVVSPVGGSVTVSQGNAVLIGRMLDNAAGNGPRLSSANVQTLAEAFGGSGANGQGQGTALVRALQSMAANPSPALIANAVQRYNMTVNAVTEAGGTPSPELLAVRQLLVAVSAQ